MNATDLHQAQTEAFINAAPTDLVINRKNIESDGAGGMRVIDEDPLDPQKIRVVGMRNPAVRISPDGRNVVVGKTVIGTSDLDIQMGDTFEYEGSSWEVVTVQRDPNWRVAAEVTRRG